MAIAGRPPAISIQLPGGAKVGSQANPTQQAPNAMDPFATLIAGAQPALASIQPVFDIIGFIMKLMNMQILQAKILGSLLMVAVPGNAFSAIFKINGQKDENGDLKDPYVPDAVAVAPDLINGMMDLLAGALKIAGLVPQLSIPMSIKDTVITAMGFADAAMAQVNSLADVLASTPPANTGNPTIDGILQCQAANNQTQLEHKMGPLANLVPLMAVVSMLADAAKQPLPSVVYDMAKILTDMGMIPFPDLSSVGGPTPEKQKEDFLGVLEDMTVEGLPIEIPDFGDLSTIGEKMRDLEAQLRPILPVIELVQKIFNKLAKA